jgi:hypothetical protein
MNIGDKVKFKDYVFTSHHFSPYYDDYQGHEFLIDSYYEDPDEAMVETSHVYLKCITDTNLQVKGCVHACDLELV